MTTAAPTTAAKAAEMIAADIRCYGHYQSKNSAADAQCCLVLNRVYPTLPTHVQQSLLEQIKDHAKMSAAWPKDQAAVSLRACAVLWNDDASTNEVLGVLDSIAASDGA